MFEYQFMRNAFLAGVMLSIIMPLIGVVVVNRRTSNIGDAISHTSLVGLSLGLLLGFSPIVGAIIIAILASFSIEKVRSFFPKNGDMATVIITSLGIGLASILSDFIPGSQNFQSYLFGSIITVSQKDLIVIFIISIFVIVTFFMNYWQILYSTIDKTSARLAGVDVNKVDNLFTLMMALTIAISSNTVGALMVTSLLVLPVATSLLFSKNYKSLIFNSIIFAMIYVFLGLIISYYIELKPGGSIVLTGVVGLIIVFIIKRVKES